MSFNIEAAVREFVLGQLGKLLPQKSIEILVKRTIGCVEDKKKKVSTVIKDIIKSCLDEVIAKLEPYLGTV